MDAETPAGVELERLQPWFRDHVPGAGDGPLHASLLSGGRSNLTYEIGAGGRRWVLRRPPLGHVLPTAHDMAREYRVLAALAGTGVPVPRAIAFCDDPAVNDASFYVMEAVDGLILRTADDLASLTPEQARRTSEDLVDVLVAIHAVDYEHAGLGDFGRPDGYLERQVRRWGEQWERSKTRELADIDDLARRLRASLPESGLPTIVHGDYRLDNTMLDPVTKDRIVAVLDWEMATLGDPLADLGLFLLYWGRPGRDAGASTNPEPSAALGYLTRDEVIARYAERSGRSTDALDFYEVLASYKLAIIIEGIHARFLMGKTLGEGFDGFGDVVERIAADAVEFADRSSIPALRA